ncbi:MULTISPECIES: hypothetical protein [Protofrankia]|uniref:hypothetical protein n=1 Tax=Protofrankia TaxID=2994361 RepID=UPI0001C5394E|nr:MULTISPECIES: hypothetical protein [Protofrankia]
MDHVPLVVEIVSPGSEARDTTAAFRTAEADLLDELRSCASGQELLAGGWDGDVTSAASLDAESAVPGLHGGAFTQLPIAESPQPS